MIFDIIIAKNEVLIGYLSIPPQLFTYSDYNYDQDKYCSENDQAGVLHIFHCSVEFIPKEGEKDNEENETNNLLDHGVQRIISRGQYYQFISKSIGDRFQTICFNSMRHV